MSASLYIAIILVIAIIAYMIVQQILNKRAVKELDQNEFHNGIYDNVQATIPRIKKRSTGILM